MNAAELTWSFLRVGAGAFGGGMAALPVMEAELAGRRGWMTAEEVGECFALAQAAPGVILVNFAVVAGGRLMGRRGAMLGAVSVVLPAFALVLGVAGLLRTAAAREIAGRAAKGLQVGVAGLLLSAAWGQARRNGSRGKWGLLAAGLAAGMALVPQAGPLAWLAAGAAAGWAMGRHDGGGGGGKTE